MSDEGDGWEGGEINDGWPGRESRVNISDGCVHGKTNDDERQGSKKKCVVDRKQVK